MSAESKKLIAQLQDFRSRKAAMTSLLLMGDEAVPDLIDALAHPMGNVRWSARTLLVQLGSDVALDRLIAAIDEPSRRNEAAAVLREVTGQSLGADRQAWAEWVRSRERAAEPTAHPAPPAAAPERAPAPKAPSPPEPLSDEALVEAALGGSEVGITQRTGGFVLRVPIEGGRRQDVTVSFASKDFEGEPLIVVYTECGPAEPKNYEWALRQNLRMSFGAVGLRDRAGQPTFVMVNTLPRSTACPEDLRKSVVLLARKGDALEEALTKSDQR